MAAAALPLTMPHISPIISLQKFAALSFDLISRIAALAPLILRAEREWKAVSSAVVIAVPIRSKRIPTAIMKSRIKSAAIIFAFWVTPVEKRLKEAERKKVIKRVFTAQRQSFFMPDAENFTRLFFRFFNFYTPKTKMLAFLIKYSAAAPLLRFKPRFEKHKSYASAR